MHLWHPPQARVCRSFGSEESLARVKAYRAAKDRRTLMAKLVNESKACIERMGASA
jgi:hypothetical protein